MADQHASLTEERWARFSLEQRLLMIANEMHRASRAIALGDTRGTLLCYERVLRLADLTIAVASGRSWRRELLRWRDLVAEGFLAGNIQSPEHRTRLRALLQLHPETWSQAPFLLPTS